MTKSKVFFVYLLIPLWIVFSKSPASGQLDVTGKPQIRNFTPEMYNAQPQNWGAIQDDRGILYFGNQEGVLEFDGTFWRKIALSNKGAAFSFAKDPAGRIYVGGNGDLGYLAPDTTGIMRFISLKKYLTEEQVNQLDGVLKTCATQDSVVFMTDKTLFILIRDQFNKIITQDHFYTIGYLKNRFFAVDGRYGLMQILGNKLEPIRGADFIRSFVLIPFQNEQLLTVTTNSEILKIRPHSVLQEPQQQSGSTLTWLCRTGIQRVYSNITCGTSVDADHLAVGTANDGCVIVKMNGDAVFYLDERKGLGSNEIYGLTKDANGHLWIGTDKGISSIYLPYIGRIDTLLTTGKEGDSTQVPGSDAFAFTAIIRGCENMVSDSLIFGGTFYKVVNGIPTLQQPPNIIPKLPYKYRSLRFFFSSTDYEDLGSIEYQTIMDDFEKRWSRWSSETLKEYTNIPAGIYTFRVRAKNTKGIISQESTFTFRVLLPWYRKWYAYILYTIIAAIIIITFGYFQRKRLMKKAETEKQKALQQAENERRMEELQKAQDLQLSMLPKEMPKIKGLEITAFMKTATEVGGDYYDYFLADDGTLILMIGDATGHGINAGMVVTTIKAMFFSSAVARKGLDFYDQSSNTVDQLFKGELLMALQMVCIKGNKLTIVSAGMPPAYYYHADTGKTEEIFIKAMPLGAFPGFPYEQREFRLKRGDTLFLESDGLPELFNADKEMFGYDAVRDLYSKIAHKPTQEIIDDLNEAGDRFRQQVPNDDDITFLVIKKV
ncbi:SpoIIE family protein phosphatase [candidate division KSB1 bacterium]|nr:SpoIIE family protein phosphatase [candidate division KSB1 bacterium]